MDISTASKRKRRRRLSIPDGLYVCMYVVCAGPDATKSFPAWPSLHSTSTRVKSAYARNQFGSPYAMYKQHDEMHSAQAINNKRVTNQRPSSPTPEHDILLAWQSCKVMYPRVARRNKGKGEAAAKEIGTRRSVRGKPNPGTVMELQLCAPGGVVWGKAPPLVAFPN